MLLTDQIPGTAVPLNLTDVEPLERQRVAIIKHPAHETYAAELVSIGKGSH
jgi:hypothetical protein